MKEIYSWVPWFRELGRKIEEGGEAYLIEKARQVEWTGDISPLEYGDEGIDPFSFFYFLASKNTRNRLKPVYDSVSHVFGIESLLPDMDIDDYYIFPTPDPRYNNFYNKKNFESDLLWRLFRQAVKNDPEIDPDDFEKALKINGVRVARLTQTLFLINPEYFLAADKTTFHLSEALGLPTWPKIEKEIEDGGYEKYQSLLKEIKEVFPECQPYEINLFLWMQGDGRIKVSNNFFHISTNVYADGKDYWDSSEDKNLNFKENNYVYTGGDFPDLIKPALGDVILVRRGMKKGKAIGVVYQNEYADKGGWEEESIIHVLWINKSEHPLSHNTEQYAFRKLDPSRHDTYLAFEETGVYKPSFDLIKSLTGNSVKNGSQTKPDNEKKEVNVIKCSLNQILYGPPGTGKTWNTVNYAVAIIDGKSLDEIEGEGREKVKQRFDRLKGDGQIEMVTFHQNFTYEDFIEGIRPVLLDGYEDESEKIQYELHKGVFREIAERANINRTQSEQISDKSWGADELLQAFAESIEERLYSEEGINLFSSDSRSGATIEKINWSGSGEFESVQLGGSVQHHKLTAKIIKRDYEAFYGGKIKSAKDIKPAYKSKRSHHGLAMYYFPLFEMIKKFHDGDEWQPEERVVVKKQNYVLIIDEINRGNIAKIFGELITLVERSKRLGQDDEAMVTLSYSKEEFGVPDNLYIIGTMNTADRSIAQLDTALRRRFEFIEMMPDSKYISDNIEGVDCQKLLDAMNKRIRFLLSREHQIGHTYFMGVKNMDQLVKKFQNSVIPLLQEYFYDNWEKIDLVLNGKEKGFIEKIGVPEDLRKSLVYDIREVYELLPFDREEWKDPESYKAIYGENGQGETGETEQDT